MAINEKSGPLSAAPTLFAASLAAQTAAPIRSGPHRLRTSSGCYAGVEPIRELGHRHDEADSHARESGGDSTATTSQAEHCGAATRLTPAGGPLSPNISLRPRPVPELAAFSCEEPRRTVRLPRHGQRGVPHRHNAEGFYEGGDQTIPAKRFLAVHQDIHARKGMLCQDCHTSGDVHGDGFAAGSHLDW